jgi:preprotein translocase subunit SecY
MVAALVGGSMLLMWLGELMSEQGVGNGISLIITAGIISQLPSTIATIFQIITSEVDTIGLPGGIELPISLPGLLLSLLLVLVTVSATYFVIKLNEAQRVIKISYAKRVRGNRAYGGIDSVLPLKLITVGVIPIIFAVAFLSVPAFVGQILTAMESVRLQEIGQTLLDWFNQGTGLTNGTSTGSYVYPAAYFSLVVLFTYFYTSIMFNPKELAENLQKQGGFIAGIRPGSNTEKYLSKIMSRLTLFGSVSLGLIAILPFLVDFVVIAWFGTPISQQLALGGTGLLILVSVAIETLRQIESKALMVSYDQDSSITS